MRRLIDNYKNVVMYMFELIKLVYLELKKNKNMKNEIFVGM